jgi:pyruvate formate lyase activating enzyme
MCANYGEVTALALDPIEKKPLARFRPGTTVLSVGSYGCNLHCPFCQNADIAQARAGEVPARHVTPDQLVAEALRLRERGCIGIAYTYNEPSISYEFVHDTAVAAHEAGLVNVLVSNGMICAEPLRVLAPYLDAANIDLKGPSQAFYDYVGGDYETVKQAIRILFEAGCHVEVTTLVIPDRNDDLDGIEDIARWLASVDPSIVYHLTRFFPCYRERDLPPTPRKTLEAAKKRARRHLHTVLLGNI